MKKRMIKPAVFLFFLSLYTSPGLLYKTPSSGSPLTATANTSGFVTAGWAPTQLFCTCDDGTRYSYGNDCKTATGLCDKNPCPPPPHGCQ